MGLTICNRFHTRVHVSIGFYDNACLYNTGPHIMGWWNLDPGRCALVYANRVNQYSRMWFFVGEAVNNGPVWAGEYVTQVPDQAFNRCWRPSVSGGHPRGFRLFDVGDNENFTLNLTG